MRWSHVVSARTSETVEVPDAPPGPGEVTVRTVVSGICSSELPAWKGHKGGAPTRLGHELSGEITALGSGVYGWRVGEAVTGFASGAYADSVNVPADALLPVPANVAVDEVLGEPVACVLEALSRSGLRPGQRVAVVGLGFMGLIALQAAATHAPARLVGVDPVPAARELAASLGAHEVCAPEDAEERSFDVVVEFTGAASGLRRAGQLASAHATLCIGGYHHSGPRELEVELWYRGVTLVNGFTPQRHRHLAALSEGLGLISARRLTLAPLITHRVALDEVDRGFGLMVDRAPGFVKCVVVGESG
ncbi:alcohol dehydrogenase catalytic domain-containing protein [Streptomyces sp. NBC_01497]|uniref:alcohol dehydrogenase catalytic domain-containing protein n=1 Tax=Streptomyces sp. NBC_01497 TaxID=2903885 RepID=UPI002E305288|nr:alcohol dehydrogenase catalytic domain-containing protein [Streptomyces sp. NBC_01497]